MSYQIADEPVPSESFKTLVCRPGAPLLAAMMCGAWLAWPWFVVNSIAIGSPTKRREILLVAAGSFGSFGLALLVFGLVKLGIIESRVTLEIALLGITTWKLAIANAVATLQARTFQVYTYYGGTVRSPRAVLIAGTYLRALVFGLIDHPIWWIIVAGGM